MGKLNDLMDGRNQGMEMALRIAKKDGIEALERELKNRGILGMSLNCTTKELNKASERIKNMTIDTILIMSCAVLRDEFEFGSKRIQRFIARFNEKTDCLCEDYVSWEDMIKDIGEEMGIDLSIRKNETCTFLNREK